MREVKFSRRGDNAQLRVVRAHRKEFAVRTPIERGQVGLLRLRLEITADERHRTWWHRIWVLKAVGDAPDVDNRAFVAGRGDWLSIYVGLVAFAKPHTRMPTDADV